MDITSFGKESGGEGRRWEEKVDRPCYRNHMEVS